MAAEWDYDKNGNLRPEHFTGGSNKKVWWKCKLGHSWQANIHNRVFHNVNCPYCTNKKVWQGFNDIVTTHPDVAAEWDYEKN
ncbi:MAG: zinc-ribbon domain-containing protein, partial [Clostridiales bacterium]|nr:zinc-ribbon domain-containing protein [Clostridiales bacterium]